MLATILALRQSAHSSHEDIIAFLKDIQDHQRAQDTNTDKTKTAIGLLTDAIQSQSDDDREAVKAEIRSGIEAVERIRKDLQQPLPDGVEMRGRDLAICRWLDFYRRTSRHDMIEKAHCNTCEWIFEPPLPHDSWSDFSAYLRGSQAKEPYFINGKAGSGKSTLMKFNLHHRRTSEALGEWSGLGPKPLILPYFF